jgi:7-carboxy-7-deazaguanine synthase
MTTLRVNETFRSLQGEGVLSGVPTSFIRLQGCNLQCPYCDTLYASRDATGGIEMELGELVDRIKGLPTRKGRWVCITGGEPLMQPEGLHSLVNCLYREGIRTSIETNGTYAKPTWWTKVDMWISDIKCPSSGVREPLLSEWLYLRARDQVKFVVGTREDLLFVDRVIRDYPNSNSTILVSPCLSLRKDGTLTQESREWLSIVADFCKETELRLSLQIHKFIWGAKKGV